MYLLQGLHGRSDVKGAFGYWRFSFWLNLIYQVNSDYLFTKKNKQTNKQKIQKFLFKEKKSTIFHKALQSGGDACIHVAVQSMVILNQNVMICILILGIQTVYGKQILVPSNIFSKCINLKISRLIQDQSPTIKLINYSWKPWWKTNKETPDSQWPLTENILCLHNHSH